MKQLITLCLSALVLFSCQSTTENPEESKASESTKVDAGYDSTLAIELGADKYGMKPYVMGLLKRGPNRSIPKEEAQKLQRAHLDNIKRLAEEGVLVLAGPFMDTGAVRGIYIFDVATIEEAESLVNTDPAIQEGSLTVELRPWYGSAGLMKVNEIHTQIAKEGV